METERSNEDVAELIAHYRRQSAPAPAAAPAAPAAAPAAPAENFADDAAFDAALIAASNAAKSAVSIRKVLLADAIREERRAILARKKARLASRPTST